MRSISSPVIRFLQLLMLARLSSLTVWTCLREASAGFSELLELRMTFSTRAVNSRPSSLYRSRYPETDRGKGPRGERSQSQDATCGSHRPNDRSTSKVARPAEHVLRLDGLHLTPVRLQVSAHQQRLVEQILKVKGPAEALQTAGKGRGMANGNDYFAVQSFCKPGRGKDRERSLSRVRWPRIKPL